MTVPRRHAQLCALTSILVAIASAMPVSALAQQELAFWQPGPGATGDSTYMAYLDQPRSSLVTAGGAFMVSGWLVDTTAQGWAGFDQVDLYSGPMDSGGTVLAAAAVGLDRPDVAAATGNPLWNASGFSAEVAGTALQPGMDTLYLYGHTPSKGWWYTTALLFVEQPTATAPVGAPNVSITRPRSSETISVNKTSNSSANSYTISGTAVDPAETGATGVGIDRIDVYLNGPRGDSHAAFLGTATLTGTDWSLTFSPNRYRWGNTELVVYVHSRLTGEETLAVQSITIS
jgi:Bacterial Ig domain